LYSEYVCFESLPGLRLSRLTVFADFLSPSPHPGKYSSISTRPLTVCSNTSQCCRLTRLATQTETTARWSKNHKTTNVFHFKQPQYHMSYSLLPYVIAGGGGVALTTHTHTVPMLKKEYNYTSTPSLRLHGLFLR
jgi:hypothetical protein